MSPPKRADYIGVVVSNIFLVYQIIQRGGLLLVPLFYSIKVYSLNILLEYIQVVMENVGYLVRIQALEEYGSRISLFEMREDYVGVLAVKHEGSKQDNPHYHIVIRTNVNQQAFRKRMKLVFPEGKGNKHMSIKCWDGRIDALSYLFHEAHDTPIVCRKGITDEFLKKIMEREDAVKVLVHEAKKKASHTLEQDVYEVAIAKGWNQHTPPVFFAQQMYLLAMRKDKYVPQQWLIKSMIAKIKFRLCDGSAEAEEALALAMANIIFSPYE